MYGCRDYKELVSEYSSVQNNYRKFMKMAGPHLDKLMDSNVSIHMKRRILQKGEVCKGILFGLVNNIDVSLIKIK